MGWKPSEAIGKEISSGLAENSYNLLIIGVVKDFHYGGVKNEISPIMFFNYQRYWTKNQMNNLQIKLPGTIFQNIERIKKYWEKEVEPGYPLKVILSIKILLRLLTNIRSNACYFPFSML